MSWSHFRSALFTGLTVVSALAQSYQTQFSEVKYDRGRAPATQHDGVEVEAATGAVSIRIPLGPGIGNEGVQLVPTLTGRWLPQAKVRRTLTSQSVTLPDGTVVDKSYLATRIFPQSNGSFRTIPGYLDIPVLEAHGKPISFSLPDGQHGTAIEGGVLAAPDIQTLEQARGLIRKFGYGTDWDVSADAGGVANGLSVTSLTVHGPLLRKGTGGELIIGLYHPTQAPMLTVYSYYGEHVVPSTIGYYCSPSRILVVRGGTAYEMLNLGQSYRQAKVDPFDPWNIPWDLTEVNYHLGRVLNRFGDSVEVVLHGAGTGYTATWKRGGVATGMSFSIQDNGGFLVSYQGVPGAPSFQVNTGILPDPLAVIENDLGVTSGMRDLKVTSVTNLGSGETTSFTYSARRLDWRCPDQVSVIAGDGFVDSFAESEVLDSVQFPNHSLNFTWGSYTYLRNRETPAWSGFSATDQWPAYAWGVTKVDDVAEGITRTTVHNRRVPIFSYQTHNYPQPNDIQAWTDSRFDSLVTHPDGSATLTRFVQPLPWGQGGPTDSDANQMHTLAFLKHQVQEVREYAIGVDASLDRDLAMSATAHTVRAMDRWDLRTLANSVGDFYRHPVPDATRARTWDRETALLTTEERTQWDAMQFGWKRSGRRIEISNGALTTDWVSLARPGSSGVEDTSSAPFREHTTTAYEFKAAEWLGPFVTSEQRIVDEDRTAGHAPEVILPGNGQAGVLLGKAYDALGRLTEIKQGSATPIVTAFTFKAESGTLAPKRASATVTGNTYALSGSVGVASFGYDAYGYLTSIKPMVDGVTDLTVSQTQDGFGRPLSQTDPNGLTQTTAWDAAGHLQSIAPPGTEKPQGYVYPSGNKRIEISHGDQWVLLSYTGFGQLNREVRKNEDGTQSHRRWYYDAAGRKTWETVWQPGPGTDADWNGSPSGVPATHFEYDTRGRLMKVTNPMAVVTTTAYNGLKKTVTTGTSSTIFANDEAGRLAKVVDANSQVTTYRYDGLGRIASVRQYPASTLNGSEWVGSGSPQLRTWTYHQEHGWTTAISQPESGTTTYSGFTVAGKPRLTTYADGLVLTTGYDGLSRVTGLVSSDGTVNQSFVFDGNAGGGRAAGSFGLAKGKMSYARNLGVEQWRYYRPGSGGLNGRIEALDTQIWSSGQVNVGTRQGFIQRFRYDDYGNRTHAFNGNSWAVTLFNTITGLPTAVGRTAADATTGQPGSVANLITAAYGKNDWLLANLTWTGGPSTFYTYDVDQARLRTMLHSFRKSDGTSDSQTWTYTYDNQNRTLGDGEDSYTYDPLGRLWTATVKRANDASFINQSFDYDAFGNLVHMQSTGALPAGSFPGANLMSFTMTDTQKAAMAQTNRLPDQVGIENPAQPRKALAGMAVITGALYDPRGNLTRIYTQAGQSNTQVTLAYDALGRVTQMSDARRAVTEFYAYTSEGLRVRTETRSGTTVQKVAYSVFDDQRKLVAQYQENGTTPLMARIPTMAAGLPPEAYIDLPAGPTTVMTGQLLSFSGWGLGTSYKWTFGDGTTATGQSATHAYASAGVYQVKFTVSRSGYPSASALVQVTVTGPLQPLAIQAFTASTSPVAPGAPVTLSWIVTGATGLSINEVGAVTGSNRVVNPSVTTTYVLTASDAGGQAVSSSLTVSVNQPGIGTWQRDIIYMGTEEIAEVDSSGTRITLTDHLGSPRLILDASGRLLGRQKFLPFGQTLDVAGITVAKGFTNHEQTDASGLIYMQARFYAPWYGRFLSPDPKYDEHFQDTQGWNIYSYVENNPTMRIDPDGRDWIDSVLNTAHTVLVDKNPVYQALAQVADVGVASYNAMAGKDLPMVSTLGKSAERGASGGEMAYRAVEGPGTIIEAELGGHLLGKAVGAVEGALAGKGVENVQRVMSKAELEATKETGLIRGGREGEHFVTDSANSSAGRARQRLALKDTPEVKATLEVPKGKFSKPTKVEPLNNMPGGGMERKAVGKIPAKVKKVEDLK